MRHLLTAGLFVSTLALCACEPKIRVAASDEGAPKGGALRVVDTLSCPDQQGVLTRVRTAPDGASCLYSGPRGAQVELRLVRTSGPAETALGPLDAEVRAALPAAVARLESGDPGGDAAPDQVHADAVRAEAEAAGDTARPSAAEAERESRTGERARVRLPGLQIDADDAGARIRVGGVRIEADDASGSVSVREGGDRVDVRGQAGAAEVRTRKGGEDLRASLIVADERASPEGWGLVGYEARGPARGPVVVAFVRVRERREEKIFDAAKALVELNVGK